MVKEVQLFFDEILQNDLCLTNFIASDFSLLNGRLAKQYRRPGFQNAISLDQFAAEHIGAQTRFPSLTLSGEGLGLSWTRTGTIVPAASSPSRVFSQLFLDGRTNEVQALVLRMLCQYKASL